MTTPTGRWRLLVVEDQSLIAMILHDMLADLGHEVAAWARRVEDGIAVLERERIDGAILDADLDGASSIPLAREMDRRGIPYLVSSGHDGQFLHALGFGRCFVAKPYGQEELRRAIERMMRG